MPSARRFGASSVRSLRVHDAYRIRSSRGRRETPRLSALSAHFYGGFFGCAGPVCVTISHQARNPHEGSPPPSSGPYRKIIFQEKRRMAELAKEIIRVNIEDE